MAKVLHVVFMEGVATGRVAKETGGVRVAVELELNELGKRVAEPALRHPSVGCALGGCEGVRV